MPGAALGNARGEAFCFRGTITSAAAARAACVLSPAVGLSPAFLRADAGEPKSRVSALAFFSSVDRLRTLLHCITGALSLKEWWLGFTKKVFYFSEKVFHN